MLLLTTVLTLLIIHLSNRRMHPEIARWPSYHFYGDRLKNGPQKRTSSFLRPYALLDSHRIGKETKKGPHISNHGEASFIGRYVENNSFYSCFRYVCIYTVT